MQKAWEYISAKTASAWSITGLFVLLAVLILYGGLHGSFLFITPDSMAYLAEAAQLAGLADAPRTEVFVNWPLGYPAAIAALSSLSGLDLLLCSKLLNVFFLAGVFLLFRIHFKEEAFWFCLLLAHASLIQLFRYTWSEPGFLFFELAFLFILANAEKRTVFSHWQFIGAVCSLLALFLFRYAALFAFGLLLWQGVIALKKGKHKLARQYLLMGLIAGTAIGLYLLRNYTLSQHFFGADRGPDVNGFWQNTIDLLLALAQQTCFIWKATVWYSFLGGWILQALLLLVVYKQAKPLVKGRSEPEIMHVLFKAAGIYFLFIVLMRYNVHFDPFNFRLLLPAVVPLLIAVILYWQGRSIFFATMWKPLVLGLAVLSLFLHTAALIF